jgi:uncharacterized damage-inducible protein DinB
MSAERLFLNCAVAKLRQLLSRIETCVPQLRDEQIWMRAGTNSNACGNLCLHLAGNVRQWILHGIGGAPDLRERDAEFAAKGGIGRDELLARLSLTVNEACAVIEALPDSRLTERIHPQSYDVTILEAILHVLEHFAQHTGQVILLTKACTGADLGFYAHLTGMSAPPPPPRGAERP